MSTVPVNLPEQVVFAFQKRAKNQGYSDVNAFITDLVVRISERQSQLEGLAIEGLESGPSEPWDASDIEKIREGLKSKHGK